MFVRSFILIFLVVILSFNFLKKFLLISRWFMPLNVLLINIIGTAFGWILIKLTRAPKELRGVIIVSCSAGNVSLFIFRFYVYIHFYVYIKRGASKVMLSKLGYNVSLHYITISISR